MPFDYKKEYKEFYMPSKMPGIIDVPSINYLAVRGTGDPNEEDGDYSKALNMLYSVSYTIKMSYKGSHRIEGFFDYVVPPLEGLWWQKSDKKIDYAHKEDFHWISLIRLPEFVTQDVFHWARDETNRKKTKKTQGDCSNMEFFHYHEGLCVQCMHLGSYDNEPATILAMERFALESGYCIDIHPDRYHHEIYLSNPQKIESAKLKTVIRHPIRKN